MAKDRQILQDILRRGHLIFDCCFFCLTRILQFTLVSLLHYAIIETRALYSVFRRSVIVFPGVLSDRECLGEVSSGEPGRRAL